MKKHLKESGLEKSSGGWHDVVEDFSLAEHALRSVKNFHLGECREGKRPQALRGRCVNGVERGWWRPTRREHCSVAE